jgi:hypothetical protein
MLRTASVVAALQLLVWSPAWACTGQIGASIFQDSFADDSGGWDQNPPVAVIQPPAYVVTLTQQDSGQMSLDQTFNATSGDYCMDVVLPPPISATNSLTAGIVLWATDYNNFMVVQVSDTGTVSMYRQVGDVWSDPIFSITNAPSFNSAANAVNSLRVTALGGTITAYLNGSMVKAVKAQQPANQSLSFGIWVEDDTPVASAPPVKITGYTVTKGQ